MNGIEVARQRAAELHEAATTRGYDPARPYGFALAEATRRDIEVEKIPKSDVRLRGGRAVYDPDALLILHEDAGDEFTNAFLVAHEIGHVELGGDREPSIAVDPDPARAAESTPIGRERVVDYSRRERREVQADIFAREFLLPRPVVRRLHVEEGGTASGISARFLAPFPVVVQQLLDALLLPSVSRDEAEAKPPEPLNGDQETAAHHLGKPYLVEAGPGTGKTQALVGRVEFLLSSGVDAGRILVLTFSNKAASELTDRILSKRPDAAAIWVGTFHAFGLDLVRRFHDRLGLPAEPRLMDRAEAIELLENEIPKLGLVHFNDLWDPSLKLREVLAAISRANDEVVDATEYRRLAEAMLASAKGDEERTDAERSREVADIFAAYEALKKSLGCVDFGDLVSAPVRLCENDAEVRAHLMGQYEHILVDEFQDVNRSSVRLLKALAGDGRNLWVVGDAKQSIYRFRGASAFNVQRFGVDDFPGGARGRLTINYRSSQEITNTFVQFAKDMKVAANTDVTLVSDRGPSGFKPEYLAVETADDEIAAVAQNILKLRDAGHEFRDQAVLCSGVERLGKFAVGLEALGVPVLYLGSLFEREEIRDLLSLLSLFVDGRAMGLVRLAATVPFSMPLGDVSAVLAHLRNQQVKPLEWTTQIGTIPGVSAAGKAGLEKVAAALAGIEPAASPWTALATILLDRSRVAAEIATATDTRIRSQGTAIWQFMNFVRVPRRGEAGYPISRLLNNIRRLVLLSDERELRQLPAAAQGINAVRLQTMHGSKGLEFPVVHLPGMNSDTLPRSGGFGAGIAPPDGMIEGATGCGRAAQREAHDEEQECLFFVALSRSRDRLFLYSPTRKANGTSRPRSPFLDRLGQTVLSKSVKPTLRLPAEPEDRAVTIHFDGTVAITDYQLALFERCPRRFLYTHILRVGGRRTETAFMKMHDAVQEVVNWLSADAAAPSDADVDSHFTETWTAMGPVDHGYSDEFQRIARRLIGYYLQGRANRGRLPVPVLRLTTDYGDIVVKPDLALSSPSGAVTLRRVRTGHGSKKDPDSLAAAAFRLAADAQGCGYVGELSFLSDGETTPVEFTSKKLANRRATIGEVMGEIRAGRFPTERSATCARCPSFFICGVLPAGPLSTRVFSE